MPKKKQATPKNKGGRPTKYSLEINEKAKQYLTETVDTNTLDGFRVDLPTLDGLAVYLGVNQDTLNEWRKIHKEFSVSYERTLAEQKKRLLNNGLGNIYNASMAKFVLSANHGMSEKTVNTNINVDVEDEDNIDEVLKSNGLI